MVTPHLEKIFFHHIIRNTNYLNVVTPRFFDDALLKKIFPVVKEFNERYHENPTVSQLNEVVKLKGMEEDINPSQLTTIWDVKLDDYEDVWLKENTETFIEYKNLDIATIDLVTYLKTTTINTENIKEVIAKAKDMFLQKNSIDFAFNEGSDFFDASKHRQLTYNTFSTGYEFIDLAANGGWSAKTLVCFLGMPKVGKSLWLGNIAAKAVLQGHNTAVITMEMDEPKYIKRLGSNILNINIADYKTLDLEVVRNKLKNISANGGLSLPGNLYVKEFPTSTASALDIESWLRKMEETKGIKFKVIVLDYLNIMKNWRNPNTENTYMKIKQIAEDIRAMAQRNNWAVITATQTKQGSFDSNDLSMSSASESSALVATVDLMFGIIQDPTMYMDKKYKLKVLANRDEGFKNAMKWFDVDYTYMRIAEDPTPIIEGITR